MRTMSKDAQEEPLDRVAVFPLGLQSEKASVDGVGPTRVKEH